MDNSPTKPKPNWARSPRWAMWWTVDEDGGAYWHEMKPFIHLLGDTGLWVSDGRLWSIGTETIPNDLKWQDLIEERPR